ncbi:unnamed protein product [Ectocarpus sp. 13 AM-2016]
MASTQESTSRRQEARGFSRSSFESLRTLGSRYKGRSKKSEMSTIEKDHAHLSKEVYENPDSRKMILRAYIHRRDEIPGEGTRPSVPLNGERWAVYGAPDEPRFVLAFRGTNITSRDDRTHGMNLIDTPIGKHKYIMDAAAWSLQVMLFLASQRRDGTCLKFSLTGHSLGGTVAMGVLLLLHDVPGTARRLAAGEEIFQDVAGLPDYETYAREFLGPWNVAKERMTWATSPYEIVGGDIFNPGAWPTQKDVAGGVAIAGAAMVSAPMAAAATAFAFASSIPGQSSERRDDRDVNSIDSLITTHHILGDPLSLNFGLGKEKSYGTSKMFKHNINNFLKENEER